MQALEIPGFSYSLPSNADFSVKATSGQLRFTNMNSAGEAVAPAAGGPIVGVRQNNPKAGEATTIVASGIVLVECSAAITIGGLVATTVNGRAAPAVTGNATLGRAMSATTAAGQFVAVLLGASNGVLAP